MNECIHAETIKRFFKTMVPGTVLVIDDDRNVVDGLSKMGFSVTDKIESDQFDYVLMLMDDVEKSEFLSRMAAIGKYGVVVSVDGNGENEKMEKKLAERMTATFQNVLLWRIGGKIYSWGVGAK